jgi:hypothetical protein
MAQTLTEFSRLWRFIGRPGLELSVHLDHAFPGSHLIWNIDNAGDAPVIVTKLIVRGEKGNVDTVPLELSHVLAEGDRLVVPTDVDWSLLNARAVAVLDVDGREYRAPRGQLAAIRREIRASMARPATPLSASEFLFGAANLTFGVAILGLGVFMLLWIIATG